MRSGLSGVKKDNSIIFDMDDRVVLPDGWEVRPQGRFIFESIKYFLETIFGDPLAGKLVLMVQTVPVEAADACGRYDDSDTVHLSDL